MRLFSLLGVLALALIPAQASVIQFSLTSDHCTGGCGTAPFGMVTISDLGTNQVSVMVSLNSPNEFVSTGFDASFGFNLIGNPSITFSGVSANFTPVANPESAGSLHMDGTGFFEYGLNCTGCGSGGSSPVPGPLNFTITGTGVSTASFEQNAAGQFFAADIISLASAGGNGNTGAVDASNPGVIVTGTPEPTSFALLGGGLVAFAFILRKRTNAKR